ncbi:hypothetical protein L211DRAFT_841412 [Terfezia boudieri ATCC MYA-4762]|uniref:Uncharacterized protein n=1 Tax=Terfezia boudieri ATCC MYA-4762 TaxID=1051890 RepID=A0A3N4LJ66_9PEZI|nr:hypothetical protein L211DRAFT_841412 [Terfezia boudieri ATCC MYA-4762]
MTLDFYIPSDPAIIPAVRAIKRKFCSIDEGEGGKPRWLSGILNTKSSASTTSYQWQPPLTSDPSTRSTSTNPLFLHNLLKARVECVIVYY